MAAWLGLLFSVPVSIAFVLNTSFGPQSRGEQASLLVEEAQAGLARGERHLALERLKLALRLAPRHREAHCRYQDLMKEMDRRMELEAEYRALRAKDLGSELLRELSARAAQ